MWEFHTYRTSLRQYAYDSDGRLHGHGGFFVGLFRGRLLRPIFHVFMSNFSNVDKEVNLEPCNLLDFTLYKWYFSSFPPNCVVRFRRFDNVFPERNYLQTIFEFLNIRATSRCSVGAVCESHLSGFLKIFARSTISAVCHFCYKSSNYLRISQFFKLFQTIFSADNILG